jgi:HD-GYP domain-containing protein (c-di-GMP phosphodiesterase class II)
MVANAIQRASLHEETARNNEQLVIVNQLGRSLTETLNAQTVYERLARSILNLLTDTSTVYIFIYDEEKKNIRPIYVIHHERVLDVSKAVDIPLGKPEEGTLSQIIYTGEPMIVNQLEEFYKNKNVVPSLLEAAALQTESALYVPLISSNKVIGVIQVQSHLPRRYIPSDARLLGLVANTAAVAIQNAHLFGQLQERVEQFAALHSIDLIIGSTTDLRISLQVVLESMIRLLKIDAVGILLYNPATLNLEYAGGVGFHSDVTQSVVRLGEGLAGRAALTREVIDVPDLKKAELPLPLRQMIKREGFVSYRCLALVAKGEVKGVLEFYHRSALPSNPEWNDLLNLLAGQAAIAMDNGMLFRNLEHVNTELELAYDATIEGWSQALELRDHDTSGHTRRMLDITIALAHQMGIPDSELADIRRGVLLHDIGKMGVPDHILLKPGPLDDEEWNIMRKHPLNAYNLLSKIAYLRSALDIPYCHHEKWDGSGYPRGLKGEQIPLSARMFSVVDVYDALLYDRPYRSAWPKEKVIAYIKDQSGKYFDPRMVEAFLEMLG